jgi:hypothetical protein
MSALFRFAQLLGVQPHQAEDALHSERAARAVLSRRSLFAAGAALAAGSVLVGGPIPLYLFTDGTDTFVAPNLPEAREMHERYLRDHLGYDADIRLRHDDSLEQLPSMRTIRIWSDDSFDNVRALTAGEWARQQGPGFLCTTEY